MALVSQDETKPTNTFRHSSDDSNGKAGDCQVAVRIRPLKRVEAVKNSAYALEWNCKLFINRQYKNSSISYHYV